MNINYEYYKVFYYVARYKSITIASKLLYNNQPNISRIIKKLEEELACPLFIRQRHGVSLTPEGEKLYKHIALAYEQISLAEIELNKDKDLLAGTLSIAVSEIALHCLLLPVLKEYKANYPNIRIKISNHSTPQAIESLRKGLVDIALVTSPFDTYSDIISFKIKAIQEVAIAANSFNCKDILNYQDLINYPLIGLEENTSSNSFYAKLFNHYNLNYRNDIEAATADQILAMVKAGLGIGFVPLEFLNSDDLKILSLEKPIPKRDICLITRKDIPLNLATNRLKEMLIKSSQ